MQCPHCGKLITAERRGRGQSNLLHKLVRAFSDASGIPFDIAKVRLKYEFGEWMEAPMDPEELRRFIAHPPYPGDFLELGAKRMHDGALASVIVFLKSEAAFTKDEETGFIDFVVSQCIRADADIEFMGEV